MDATEFDRLTAEERLPVLKEQMRLWIEADLWCRRHWVHGQTNAAGWWQLAAHHDNWAEDFEGLGESFLEAFDHLMTNIEKDGATESFKEQEGG